MDKSGKYLSWLTNDLEKLGDSIFGITIIFYSIVELLTLLILSLLLSVWIALAIVSSGLIFFIVTILVKLKVEQYGNCISNTTAQAISKIEDITSGYSTFQLAGKTHKTLEILSQGLKEVNKRLIKLNTKVSMIKDSIPTSFHSIFQGSIVLLTGFLIFKDSIPLASFFVLINIFSMMVSSFGNTFVSFSSIASVKRIFKRSEPNKDTHFKTNLSEQFNSLKFKNISLSFEENKIFQQLNLTFKRGKKYAIIGKNGCGKSTLIKLLFELIKQENGEILWDNVSLKDIDPRQIRDRIYLL